MPPSQPSTMEALKGTYDVVFQREKYHQNAMLEYNEKITEMQDQFYSRLQEEKERSTQLTVAFMQHHQQMNEIMYQLMNRVQSALLSDRDCIPLSQLQTCLFSLGNDQLDAFNAFSVLTTNNKRTNEHIRRKALAKKLDELCEEIRTTLRSLEELLAVNTTLLGAVKNDLQESVTRIELAIQSFLKVFGKLRLVLNMHNEHVEGISPAFDRMHREIASMPSLNCVSALEVIESGLHQLAMGDSQGQVAIADGSSSVQMGNKGSVQGAVDRERYAALQKQKEIELAAQEKLAEQERDARDKLEEQFRDKAAIERRAHEDKMRLEREKMDMFKEASEIQLRMMEESNARQRETERDAENQRRELEKSARENETRLREESERKREMERAEAKAREEAKQNEATAAINEANKSVMEMKDKTHAEITRMVEDHHKNTDNIMKENLKIIQEKDAANAEKMEKLTTTYDNQKREAQEMAQKREDALNLERKALDEKYRKDMELASKQSKEEREKMTNDYHSMIEKKDRELSENQRDKEAKMDELNKNHLADLRKAHEEYNKLQETSKADMERLHKEKEAILQESAKRERASAEKMLEMNERNHKKILALTNQATYQLAVNTKIQLEVLRNVNCDKELGPIRIIKSELEENAKESCELWEELEDSIENQDEIKKSILEKSQSMKKNTTDLLITIDKCRSLGEQKKQWKKDLLNLERQHAVPYSTAVRRAYRDEETSIEMLHELAEKCRLFKEAIQDLPDMEVESIESLMNNSAQGTITFTENLGAMKAIGQAEKEQTERGYETNGEAPMIEES